MSIGQARIRQQQADRSVSCCTPKMLRLAYLLTFLLTLALANISGPAQVIDGDTLEVAGQRIRLHSIPPGDFNRRPSLARAPFRSRLGLCQRGETA